MKTHELKIEQEYLDEIIEGNKKSEIRLNDRDYQKGDILEFTDYSDFVDTRQRKLEITHIHSGLGMEKNYVALSIKLIS